MIEATSSLLILRPVERVFAFVADFSQTPNWLEACVELRQVTPGPQSVGAGLYYRYRQGGRTGEMEGTITAHEPGGRLEMKFSEPAFAVEVSFQFLPSPGGTTVTHRIGITPKSTMARLMTPMISAGNRQQVAQNLARLKRELEPPT